MSIGYTSLDPGSFNAVFRERWPHLRFHYGDRAAYAMLYCGVCSANFQLDPCLPAMSRSQIVDSVEALISRHKHEPPKPLIPEEKERVRIVGIHRRGAHKLLH